MDPTKCPPGTIFTLKLPDEQTTKDYNITCYKDIISVNAAETFSSVINTSVHLKDCEFILGSASKLEISKKINGKYLEIYRFVITKIIKNTPMFSTGQRVNIPGVLVKSISRLYDIRDISKLKNSVATAAAVKLLSKTNPCLALADKYNKSETIDSFIAIMRKNTPNVRFSMESNTTRLESLLKTHLIPSFTVVENTVSEPMPFVLDCSCGEVFTIRQIVSMLGTDKQKPGMSFICPSCLRKYEMVIYENKLVFRDTSSKVVLGENIYEDIDTFELHDDMEEDDEEGEWYDDDEENEEEE